MRIRRRISKTRAGAVAEKWRTERESLAGHASRFYMSNRGTVRYDPKGLGVEKPSRDGYTLTDCSSRSYARDEVFAQHTQI
jgi:hypothetical protein